MAISRPPGARTLRNNTNLGKLRVRILVSVEYITFIILVGERRNSSSNYLGMMHIYV